MVGNIRITYNSSFVYGPYGFCVKQQILFLATERNSSFTLFALKHYSYIGLSLRDDCSLMAVRSRYCIVPLNFMNFDA